MTGDGWITIGVIVGMVVVMAANLAGPDLVLIGALTLLLLSGVLEPAEAFIGFSNPAVVTIAALFIVAAGVKETGGLDLAARVVLGRPRSLAGAQLRMMFPAAALSAFLNNTPVVAMFVPLVTSWARRCQFSVSLMLMPLSYAAILGGMCTLIGTSTNLVVAGLAKTRDPTVEFQIFEIAQLGIPALCIGMLFIVVASRWLLKDRQGALQELGKAREYTIAMRVERGSPVIGQSIEDAGLRSLRGVYLYEIERGGRVLAAVPPSTVLREGDRLHFTGVVDSVVDLRKQRLVPDTDQVDKITAERDRSLVEAVIGAHSALIGQTIKQSRFRTIYDAAILAVHRQGVRVTQTKVGDIRLQAGDVLLIESHPEFAQKRQTDPNFALIAEVEDSTPPRHDRAWLAAVILFLMVLVNATGSMDLMTASLGAGALMLVTRCLTGEQARRSLDWTVLIAIAAAFGIAAAIEGSGVGAAIAGRIIDVAEPFGRVGVLVALYAITAVLAGLVTTKASAALMFPIAASAAEAQGIGLLPISYMIMIAASTAFSTPIGFQTNLMVYGPGGYKYTDFLRLGLPLQTLVGISTVSIVALAWL
ncbi:MAG: SLC13 family permease [Myxococcales bacterium]|nr:SLC13 family permease [Myxococcales bacterium]MDH3483300.1 SLC13 family permease [Myxococcales bacterium]